MHWKKGHRYSFLERQRHYVRPLFVCDTLSTEGRLELKEETDIFMNPILGVYVIKHTAGWRPLRA